MAQAIFDIAEQLNLYFRRARVGSKTFTFLNSDGDAYSVAAITFQLNIKSRETSSDNVLQLTSGSGLTISTNTIVVAVTEVQSNLPADIYYWELYDATNKKTWLCGRAYFTQAEPADLNDSTSVTVNLDPDTVRITLTGSVTEIDGGTA
jgi:hypothetical protein